MPPVYFLLSTIASANPSNNVQRSPVQSTCPELDALLASVLLTLERLFFWLAFVDAVHATQPSGTARLEFFYTKALFERLRQQYNAHETPPTPGSTVCVDAVAAAA